MKLASVICIAMLSTVVLGGCTEGGGDRTPPTVDSGPPVIDAGPRDSGVRDSGPTPVDSGPPDSGPPDSGPVDSGPPDAGMCAASCSRDLDCESACAPVAGSIHCCDVTTNTCYRSSAFLCPAPDVDSGTDDMWPY